tara:strand:+ start:1940 stop:2302 length:363 start_codon:yes stop_codon:yes gene_type:complete
MAFLIKRYCVLSSAFSKITISLPSCTSLQSLSELLLDIHAWTSVDVIRSARGLFTLSINEGELFMHAFFHPEQEALNSVSIVDVSSGKQVSVMDGISCDGFELLVTTFNCFIRNNKRDVA